VTHEPWADLWLLDPAVDYLNHGSFGACPKTILEKQSELRLRLEKEPVDFFIRALPGLTSRARRRSSFPSNFSCGSFPRAA
jgi:isopenicillin-N epimerase